MWYNYKIDNRTLEQFKLQHYTKIETENDSIINKCETTSVAKKVFLIFPSLEKCHSGAVTQIGVTPKRGSSLTYTPDERKKHHNFQRSFSAPPHSLSECFLPLPSALNCRGERLTQHLSKQL